MKLPAGGRGRCGAWALAALVTSSCTRDVLVGVNRTQDSNGGDGGDGGDGGGLRRGEPGELRAVRRPSMGDHITAGSVGCADGSAAGCDGWLGTVGANLTVEAPLDGDQLDRVDGLALLGSDRVIAGMRASNGIESAWTARRSPAGLVWQLPLTSDPVRPSSARAIEVAPDGTMVVAGNERLDIEETGWVARIRPDGALAARKRLGGTPSASTTTVEAIAVLPNSGGHRVYVGGQTRIHGASGIVEIPIVLELDEGLTFFNSKSGIGFDGALRGSVRTILTDRPREVTACAQVDDGIGVSRMFDYLSDVIVTRILRDDGGPISFGACTITDDGALLLVGAVERPDGPRPWAAALDRVTLEPRRTRTYEDELGRPVAVAPSGSSPGAGLAVGTANGHHYFLEIVP